MYLQREFPKTTTMESEVALEIWSRFTNAVFGLVFINRPRTKQSAALSRYYELFLEL